MVISLSLYMGSCAFAQSPVQPPKGNRLEAERFFTEAYKALVASKYWDAEKLVNQSLKSDPYHIDCYILRSLIRQRMGYTENAIGDLKSYLEVRPRDDTARQILNTMEKFFLKPIEYNSTEYDAFRQPIKTFFKLNPAILTGTLGLVNGHSFGDEIALADAIGQEIQIFDMGKRRDLKVESPSDVFFIDRSHFVVLSEKGFIQEFKDDGSSFDVVRSGDIGEGAGSLAFLSSGILAVTRPLDRRLDFYSYPSLAPLRSWAPEDVEFFEPRDVAVRGDMIAISDRRNDSVYISRWESDEPIITLKKEAPRSLAWGPTGDLIVLSDIGTASIFSNRGKWEQINEFNVSNSSCLFSYNDSLLVPSSDGRYLTKISTRPGKSEGVLLQIGLCNPRTDSVNKDSGQIVEVSVRISTPFAEYVESERGVLTAVWKDTMKGGRISATKVDRLDGSVLSSANRYRFNGDIWMAIENRAEIYLAIQKLWESTPYMSQLILDSSVKLDDIALNWIDDFCVINGIAISAWATEIPSGNLISAVENTGGKVYYSDSLSDSRLKDLKTKNFTFKIFYPDTVYSSGYPTKNMLSTIADFGMISYRGWLPIWPDMLR